MSDDDLEDMFSEVQVDEPRAERPALVAAAPRAQLPAEERAEAVAARVPGSARIWVRTFGCAHNTSDSEYMAGILQAYGYQLVIPAT